MKSRKRSPGRVVALPAASASESAFIFTKKFFKSSYSSNLMENLVHIARLRSKISFSNTPVYTHDLKVKVSDF